jgi:spore coat protein H
MRVLVAALALAACGDDAAVEGDDAGADGGGDVDASGVDASGVDPTAALYDPDHVVELAIELDPGDWDALRFQTRSILDIFGVGCLEGPFASPFTYFPAAVTIDGERIETVGVRKKGFLGSLSSEKPSLAIKLDELEDHAYAGLHRLTFNNGAQDPSLVRQCLAFGVFTAAGLPAPRCNYAQVTVNGDDLGVYVNVEPVNRPFLRRHFGDDDGNLYEGTLSDFRPSWQATFEKETNEEDPSTDDLDAVTLALEMGNDGLQAELAPLVDLDAFLDFWAVEVLLAHTDGYASNTNNFSVYADPADGRFTFIPWGVDRTFIVAGAPPVMATGMLARRLYENPPTRLAYVDALRAVLDDVWDEEALKTEIDRMEALIAPRIGDAGALAALTAAIEEVRAFVDARRPAIEAALAPAPPELTGEVRDTVCMAAVGTLSATFTTTWGTFGVADPFVAGTADLALTVNDAPVAFTATGSAAGLGGDGSGVIALVGALADGTVVVVVAQMAPVLVAPGTVPIDWLAASGYVVVDPPGPTESSTIAYLEGTLELEAASMTAGAPVSGAVEATLLFWQ